MRKLFYILYLLSITGILCAQEMEFEEPISRLVIPEVGFSLTSPTGVFGDRQEIVGFGIDVGILFQLNADHPYVIGLTGFYNLYGSNSDTFFETFDGIETEITETATSHLIALLGTIRYYPDLPIGELKLYTEFSFGPKILYTTLRLTDDEGGDFVNEFDFEEGDVSLSYGVGLGVQFPLSSFIYLNGKATYLPGVSAGYYAKNNEISETGFALDGFDFQNSSTNLVAFTLGVSFFL